MELLVNLILQASYAVNILLTKPPWHYHKLLLLTQDLVILGYSDTEVVNFNLTFNVLYTTLNTEFGICPTLGYKLDFQLQVFH